MELAELEARLLPFVRAKYDDPAAEVSGVHKMPGHAGFAYGFSVQSRGASESWFLRLPPPNVQWQGTADVLRQVAILAQPATPAGAGKLLDLLGQTAEARPFAALGEAGRLKPGIALPAPTGVFPRYVEAKEDTEPEPRAKKKSPRR